MTMPPVLVGLLFELRLVFPSVAAAQPAPGLFSQAPPDVAHAAMESFMGKDGVGKDGLRWPEWGRTSS